MAHVEGPGDARGVVERMDDPSGAPVVKLLGEIDISNAESLGVRLDQLIGEHQPVFVNLTAAWCITCLVNEHTALDSQAVRAAFAKHRIVALKGDWTRQNPEITGFLQEFGRSGVPLYLLYDKAGTPTILPQILTEATVLAALEKI